MGLLKNKKGVEGLPFKYIIIALVAALVIGIALQFTGILGDSIISQAERIDDSLSQEMICQLDKEAPDITVNNVYCNITSNLLTIDVGVTDECGVARVYLGYYNDTENTVYEDFKLRDGNKLDGVWFLNKTIEDVTPNIDELKIWINVVDESLAENRDSIEKILNCVEENGDDNNDNGAE